jgi:hypothetical protein
MDHEAGTAMERESGIGNRESGIGELLPMGYAEIPHSGRGIGRLGVIT